MVYLSPVQYDNVQLWIKALRENPSLSTHKKGTLLEVKDGQISHCCALGLLHVIGKNEVEGYMKKGIPQTIAVQSMCLSYGITEEISFCGFTLEGKTVSEWFDETLSFTVIADLLERNVRMSLC
jgi:hypothetical protein